MMGHPSFDETRTDLLKLKACGKKELSISKMCLRQHKNFSYLCQ